MNNGLSTKRGPKNNLSQFLSSPNKVRPPGTSKPGVRFNEITLPDEMSRWRRFWTKVRPWLRRKRQLSERYLKTKVAEAEAEANLRKHKASKAQFDNIDRVSPPGSRENTQLKLAILVRDDPTLLQQITESKYSQEDYRPRRPVPGKTVEKPSSDSSSRLIGAPESADSAVLLPPPDIEEE